MRIKGENQESMAWIQYYAPLSSSWKIHGPLSWIFMVWSWSLPWM